MNHDERWNNRLNEYLDGELPAGERPAVESHLSGCAPCRRRHDEWRRFGRALRSALTVSASEAFVARVTARAESARIAPWRVAFRWMVPSFGLAAAVALLALTFAPSTLPSASEFIAEETAESDTVVLALLQS